MYDGLFAPESKDEFLERSRRYWNPDKIDFWLNLGIDLVIGRRREYFLFDISGRRLIDLHLNGGTYNLGHRSKELVSALRRALDVFDLGNHHFPSLARTVLAEALVKSSPPNMRYTIYASGGGEAIDIAIKTARRVTKRKTIVCIHNAFHGHTGLAVAAGSDRFSRPFLVDRPAEFRRVDFNDRDAMRNALEPGDVAAVLLESIPATYGFPMPAPGYLAAVKQLCEHYNALYIADEVQTGLMRTGEMWAAVKHGVHPDILVTAKGIGGGLYPMGCVVVSDECGQWLREDGFGHVSTGGGGEVGCVVSLKVLEITQRPEVRALVEANSERLASGLRAIQSENSDFFHGIRQDGLVMGLEFTPPDGAVRAMKSLYAHGLWAIFSTLEPSVLQFKPGLLLSGALCDEILERMDTAVRDAGREQHVPALPTVLRNAPDGAPHHS